MKSPISSKHFLPISNNKVRLKLSVIFWSGYVNAAVYPYLRSSTCRTLCGRPFFKIAAENSNKLKFKTDTRNRKSTFTLVTLQSFSISGVISAEKMKVDKFTNVCMIGCMAYNPSQTNVCKICQILTDISQLI